MRDEKLPETVNEAVQYRLDQLNLENRLKLKSITEADLILLHHDYGTGLRNALGLWNDSPLTNTPELRGIHPDDRSMYLIEQLWKLLQDMPSDDGEEKE